MNVDSLVCAKRFLIGALILLMAISTSILAGQWRFFASILSCALLIVYVGGIYRRDSFFGLLSMPVLFNYIWFSVSFILFELGAYTPELRMGGHITGGTARLVLFLYLFILFSRIGFDFAKGAVKEKPLGQRSITLLLSICAVVVLSIMATYLVYGTAFSNAVDRIQFRSTIAPKAFSQLVTILVFVSFFLGLFRRTLGAERRLPVLLVDALFVFNMVLLALGGEKFSLLFTSVSLYLAPQFWGRRLTLSWGRGVKYFLLGLLALGAIVLLAINQYMEIAGGQVWDVIGNLFLDRIAQQAQLNFYFDKLAFIDGVTHGNLWTFVERELLGLDGDYRGIQLLMNAASPSDLFAIYADAGVTFGDGFPGILLYYFRWETGLLMALFGMIYGVLTGLCARVALEGRVITGLVLFYLFYNISLSAFLNGELHLLLDMTASKIVALVLLLMITAWRYWVMADTSAETFRAKIPG
jgi:hypothetical protein